ncbi:MAG: excinuclease ABC subunit UvrA [Phycisphaerales bacterium]
MYADGFSPNTPSGACPTCHGLGRIYDVTEQSMVPDPSKTIRERAVEAWPQAWGGQNQRDILVSMGIDVDIPWRELPKKTREWILFTDEQPELPVYPGYTPEETQRAIKRKEPPNYMGTFTGVRKYVLHTFATTQSALMKRRVAAFMTAADCPECRGKRLKREALSVTFAGLDIADLSREPIKSLDRILAPYAAGDAPSLAKTRKMHPERAVVAQQIAQTVSDRITVLMDLGLGYLSLERSTPTLSPGELQRLRLATQVSSNLFGVVYVLDEPSAGLHPADTAALLRALDRLKAAGNTIFVVEHEIDVIHHADWIVDIGPEAGQHGGRILYSGPTKGLAEIEESRTRRYLFAPSEHVSPARRPRTPTGVLNLRGITRNNLHDLSADIPLGVMTAVTGVSGSGKSSLVTQALVELTARHLGHEPPIEDEEANVLERAVTQPLKGRIEGDTNRIKRLVQVDQKPIGRTPRSNLATYTGLFDHIRKLFADTPAARSRRFDAGRFSFNVAKGRCENCQGEGFVMVELLFLPSVYTPCPVCSGARYNAKTLEVTYRDKNIADVLGMTVDDAWAFFQDAPAVCRALGVVREVGLGYLRLGQPATELSGGEAQRIKLATELQRAQHGNSLYVLDEPTTGLHPADVERLMAQLDGLVAAGNTVVVVEHDMRIIAGADHVIDMGPGPGDEGGRVIAVGTPLQVAKSRNSRTAPYLARFLKQGDAQRPRG